MADRPEQLVTARSGKRHHLITDDIDSTGFCCMSAMRTHWWRKIVMFTILLWCTAARAEDADQEADDYYHYGVIEYEMSCLPCHGVNGKGDGPLARRLKTQPPDLTQIERLNDGVFPADRLKLMIDGREIVAAHGPREMPVWGERYRRPVPDAEAEWDIEAVARLRIDALVSYIEGMQE
jgi:hypothetical protein